MLPNNRQRRNHNTFDKYLDTNEKENLQKLTGGSKSSSKVNVLGNSGLPPSTRKLSINNLILFFYFYFLFFLIFKILFIYSTEIETARAREHKQGEWERKKQAHRGRA